METIPAPELFKLHAPLLQIGHKDTPLYQTESMWMHLKIYADGGENDLHAHPTEEHSFLVLDGQATFFDREGRTMVVGKWEGVLLPKGAFYRFRSSGSGPLVMLRTGTGSNVHLEGKRTERLGPDGRPMPFNPNQVKKGQDKPVPIPGKFWPDNA